MAIKERKQITGTEAQIKGYAGHNGVLAYATDTKHLHVLSGTAGTTTKLANMSDIPAPVDISGKADKTYVDTQLGTKATKTELTTGLAGKANSSHTHTVSQVTNLSNTLAPYAKTIDVNTGLAGKANSSHTHTVSQVTNLQAALDAKTNDATLQVDLTKIRQSITAVSSKVKSTLPNYSSYVQVSTGDFTPTYDGWIRLYLSASSDYRSFTVKHKYSNQVILNYAQARYPGSGWFMCPLVAGETYTISSSESAIYFHPMR